MRRNNPEMILDKTQTRSLYDRIAGRYDRMLVGFRLVGIDRQRRHVVAGLGLKSGGTVVDLCCGTGENLRYLVTVVGPEGKVFAVDLSPEMLVVAKQKARDGGWENVTFAEADVEQYQVPPTADAVLSTFGLEMVPGHDAVIERLADELPSGARFGLLGLKQPERWPRWLLEIGLMLTKVFGVSRDYDFRPWEAARRYMEVMEYKPLLFGAAYRCIARVRSDPA